MRFIDEQVSSVLMYSRTGRTAKGRCGSSGTREARATAWIQAWLEPEPRSRAGRPKTHHTGCSGTDPVASYPYIALIRPYVIFGAFTSPPPASRRAGLT